MARGRHRHTPLHRRLVPSGIGGFAVLCAAAGWLVVGDAEALTLRVLITVTAGAAVAAAVLLHQWDVDASRRVAKERAGRAAESWRAEERQAELEEAQELVGTLEDKVRAKRLELGRLRSEHAALLRRYAHAENERANALEGRRRLALETASQPKALAARATDHRTAGGAPTPLTYLQAYEALGRLPQSLARQRRAAAPQPLLGPQAPSAPAARPAGPGAAPLSPVAGRERNGQDAGGFDYFGTHADPPADAPPPPSAPPPGPSEGDAPGTTSQWLTSR
ncbi:hypothetical protein PJ985_03550 [Streptomyces sp. ACA25]|uniref:hypothetical protein n=1 Tax=Streptomyces sp. ACA25 TaxID=3022596 RepID=UPI0023078043|nr:hypothetical protein [Streptomyces sp. ACA25]MDB1086642.1 hypothetical protein [Streptomyces sp. ACA25]